MAFGHIVAAALMTGGFVLAGVSAWHFIRRTAEVEFFRKSLRLGVTTAALSAAFVQGFGFAQFGVVGPVQPTKYGSEEDKAAMLAEWAARYGPGDYAPPDWVGAPLGIMIQIGFLLGLVAFLIPLFYRDWIVRLRLPLYLLLACVPLPFVAAIGGWLAREVGRQPWAAYGLLRVEDAVSPASAGTMLATFLAFSVLLISLAIADWVLIARVARRGPDVTLGRPPAEPAHLEANEPALV